MQTQTVIYIIGCLDFVAVSMLLPLIHTHLSDLGASPSFAGLSSSLYGGVQLLSSPIMGSWSDRTGRQLILIICLLACGCGFFIIAVANSLAMIIFARVLIGVFKHTQTLCKAQLSEITAPTEKSKAFGYLNATSSMGFIFGPIIGGHLSETENGFFRVAALSGIIFLLNAGLVWIFLPNKIHKSSKNAPKKIEKIHFLHEIRWLDYWYLFLLKFYLMFGPLLYRSNNTLLLRQSLGYTPKTLGYIVSFQGLVSALAGFAIGPLYKLYKRNTYKMLFHFIILQGLSFCSLVMLNDIITLLLGLALLCVSNVVCRISVTKFIVDKSDSNQLGAVLGFSQSISSIARMIAPIFSGFLQEWSLSGPPISAALSSLISLIILSFISG